MWVDGKGRARGLREFQKRSTSRSPAPDRVVRPPGASPRYVDEPPLPMAYTPWGVEVHHGTMVKRRGQNCSVSVAERRVEGGVRCFERQPADHLQGPGGADQSGPAPGLPPAPEGNRVA